MLKLSNIRLKNTPNIRTLAILDFKRQFNFGIKESKDIIDRVLEKGELVCDGGYYDLINEWKTSVEAYMIQFFDYDKTDDGESVRESNENIREPDETTAEALAWLETLSDKDKERIKLIGDWEHPYCGLVAVC